LVINTPNIHWVVVQRDVIVLLYYWVDQDIGRQSIYPRRCEVDCKKSSCDKSRPCNHIWIYKRNKKKIRINTLCEYTENARVLMATETPVIVSGVKFTRYEKKFGLQLVFTPGWNANHISTRDETENLSQFLIALDNLSCSICLQASWKFCSVLQILLKKLLLEKKNTLFGKNNSSAASVYWFGLKGPKEDFQKIKKRIARYSSKSISVVNFNMIGRGGGICDFSMLPQRFRTQRAKGSQGPKN